MMFGSKKRKQLEEQVPESPTKAEVVEAKILQEDKAKRIEWLLSEFANNYSGLISEKDLEQIDPEATSLNLLFAIFGELRLLRAIKEQEMAKR